MNRCPSQDILRRFLDDSLEQPEQQQVIDHLESCLGCQRVVHEFVFEAAGGDGGADLRSGPWDTENDREILDALARMTPPCTEPSLSEGRPTGIAFPAPGTIHGALGRLGAYHIQDEIGGGTYGVVFKAYEEKLERVVALKFLRPELAGLPGARQRFEREARAAARLNNPHVVVIHGVFDETPDFPLPFIAMEFVEGMSLHDLIRDHPQGLDPRMAVRLAQQVARGLAAAHGLGIVHRDVKPENILLRGDEDGWHAKITDFGIAHVVEEARVRSPHASIIGTPHYMSPEAFLSPETVDGRSDIYSLGVMLYRLLTGRLPFSGKGVERVRRAVVDRRFEPPRRWNPKVRPDLEAVVLKCMAHEPGQRYETAAELAEQLERWLNNEPVGAWRYRAPERVGLWCRRNRWLAAFLAAAALVVLVLGLWQQSDSALRRREELVRAKVVDDYWNTAESQEKTGRYSEAAATLEKSLAQLNLKGRPDLVPQRQRVENRIGLLRRRDEFTRNSDRAWFSAGEERGEATRVACEDALKCYDVLDRPDWYAVPPASELPSDSAALVQAEAHRLLLLLAAMRLETGILAYVRFRFPLVENQVHLARAALQRARELETLGAVAPSKTAALLEKGTRRLIDQPGRSGSQRQPPNAPNESANTSLLDDVTAEDGFFIGVMHVYLAKHQSDPLAILIRRMGPREFDYDRPRETAADMLRRAVQLEPRQYWSSFMLGRILAFRGPDGKAGLHEALQAFNTCVSLRPDYSRGYEQRALTLVQLSLEAPTPQRRAVLQQEAGEDLAKAIELAPEDPSTHWVRGQAFDLMGDTSKALAAFTRALEREDDLQEKVSRRNQLEIPRRLVKQVLETSPQDPAARRLSELIERAGKP
jgi:tetratricopeptide (TPR) repeat protein